MGSFQEFDPLMTNDQAVEIMRLCQSAGNYDPREHSVTFPSWLELRERNSGKRMITSQSL